MPANQSTYLSTPNTETLRASLLTLAQTADQFVKHDGEHTVVWAASRDWFLEPWGRDTFVALPGLLLSTRRLEEAQQVFQQFAAYEKNGLIPNRIQAHEAEYNTVDAALWFVAALQKYFEVTQDKSFVKSLWPTVQSILKHYQAGTQFERFGQAQKIYADEDGLIVSPAQSTWMDADPLNNGQSIVTPRHGKCVEINSLWYAALNFAAQIETGKKAKSYEDQAALVKKSFNAKFWNKDEQCLLDVVEGDPHGGAIRPNQIFAISHGRDLLSKLRQRRVLDAVKNDLLTPGGLRTLSPRDSHYHGDYNTQAPIAEKDWAYHQGTAWPWLLGAYVDALFMVRPKQGKYAEAVKAEALEAIAPLLQFALDSPYRSLPEVFSGDAPHEPGGTTSQAWSVAEVLRVATDYDLV